MDQHGITRLYLFKYTSMYFNAFYLLIQNHNGVLEANADPEDSFNYFSTTNRCKVRFNVCHYILASAWVAGWGIPA
ncbi:MAG: hypothetical protein R2769_10910 [Saprospiraceae bacterium]